MKPPPNPTRNGGHTNHEPPQQKPNQTLCEYCPYYAAIDLPRCSICSHGTVQGIHIHFLHFSYDQPKVEVGQSFVVCVDCWAAHWIPDETYPLGFVTCWPPSKPIPEGWTILDPDLPVDVTIATDEAEDLGVEMLWIQKAKRKEKP